MTFFEYEVALRSCFLSFLDLRFVTSNNVIDTVLHLVTSEYENRRGRLVGGLHKRLGINFNNSLLGFISVLILT